MFVHCVRRPDSRACWTAGISRETSVPMIAMTHCEAAKVITKFGAAAEGFLCPTQWAETLSYKDGLFGTAADYDKLFKKTYEGYKNVPYQAAQASAACSGTSIGAFQNAMTQSPMYLSIVPSCARIASLSGVSRRLISVVRRCGSLL